MATKLPDWLSSYLLARGLFSDRFNTPVEEERETEQTPFQNIVKRIIEGDDFDPEDAPSTGSMGSLPSLSSLFGGSSPTSSSSQGLFGGNLPGFLGEMERQSMASIAGEIARNTNYSIQDRIGGAMGVALSSLIPAPLSLFGMAMNAAGYGPSFDPEENTNLTVDPIAGIAKYDKRVYTDLEPNVPEFSRIDLFEKIPELVSMPVKDQEKIGLMGPFNTQQKFSPFSFLDQYTATPEQQALASLTSTDIESLQEAAAESVDSEDGTGGFGVGDAEDGAGGGLGY